MSQFPDEMDYYSEYDSPTDDDDTDSDGATTASTDSDPTTDSDHNNSDAPAEDTNTVSTPHHQHPVNRPSASTDNDTTRDIIVAETNRMPVRRRLVRVCKKTIDYRE